ncbi:hypothetical protein TTHERM_00713490 (macronuclear) [Tetrahymena thermophila SB210]|uniref:Uncharacterized protein n=1 Tax=Tetrahymena thermophila (strain SB210) TaxID=312017 RepID=Q24CV3_TETTS|nr:hypothetical protein TTHERM_00713490 [Tetrahymena thermophila SB210]EAS05655.1 hypothetical protein TTHERM_00713490 [Tetrahymena thermophila SB210]|eukprot:XP_001025900.1 hypothetical protein TTHERM_00713490 [Tetrahymena thermophila SB210]
MPRKPKYIPKDYENEQRVIEQIKKKKRLNYMVVVPINYNFVSEYKFCFSGDLVINLKWFSEKNLRLSESYDQSFKGIKQLTNLINEQLIECEYYSKAFQVNDYQPIIFSLESISSQSTEQLINRLKQAQEKCYYQKILANQLFKRGINLQQCYVQAKQKANQILSQFNTLNLPITYAIQQYNPQFNQLEKTYNGANYQFYKIYTDQSNSVDRVRNKTTSFYNSISDMCLLQDPYTIEDDAREMVVTTVDGVLMKVLNLQKNIFILPFYFFILKIRIVIFDSEDLQKLNQYRKTNVLQFPLQQGFEKEELIYQTKSSQEPDYIDYSPNYDTKGYFTIQHQSYLQNYLQKNSDDESYSENLILPIKNSENLIIVQSKKFESIWTNSSESNQQENLQKKSSKVLDFNNSFRVEMAKPSIHDETISDLQIESTQVLFSETQNKYFYDVVPILKQIPNKEYTQPNISNQNEMQKFISKFYPNAILQNKVLNYQVD